MAEKSIFEKIADRELPGFVIWEDETHIAFLTIEPFNEGHTLVVPKKNLGAELFALDDEDYLALMTASKKVAAILKEKLKCDRVLMWVQGFEVPHVHVHLIPSDPAVDLSSSKVKMASTEELAEAHQKISD